MNTTSLPKKKPFYLRFKNPLTFKFWKESWRRRDKAWWVIPYGLLGFFIGMRIYVILSMVNSPPLFIPENPINLRSGAKAGLMSAIVWVGVCLTYNYLLEDENE